MTPVWHVISGTELLASLRRCTEDDPDMVYAELYANAVEREHVDGGDPPPTGDRR